MSDPAPDPSLERRSVKLAASAYHQAKAIREALLRRGGSLPEPFRSRHDRAVRDGGMSLAEVVELAVEQLFAQLGETDALVVDDH